MQFIDSFLQYYGWEGAALAGAICLTLGVQLYYYIVAYGRIPGYKNNRREARLDTEPTISVIIPMFSEDYAFVEERLPLFLAQSYSAFEVVIVYVGHDSDFFEDLERLRHTFPQVVTTKIHYDTRYPISRKMALNVGIKSAHNECMIFSSTAAAPTSDKWLSLMAKGFMRGEIVLGYCGVERTRGLSNYFMRMWRMMHSVEWLARAVRCRTYRGTQHNFGFTKQIYYDANGFNCLNMNIGEDDLFLQKVATHANVSVILSPRAMVVDKVWGNMSWWAAQQRYYGSAAQFYPQTVKNFTQWEGGSRLLFFASVICALAVMPIEYKLAALTLLLGRYAVVLSQVARVAKRLGERGVVGRYFIYDMCSPLAVILFRVMMLRRDERVWR